MTTRRSFILYSGLGAVVPGLVKADSLVGLPGDPATAKGLYAASKWVAETYCDGVGCRLVFADGTSTRWMTYQTLSRPFDDGRRNYAVAIDVMTPDPDGKKIVTSVPVDSVMVERREAARLNRAGDSRAIRSFPRDAIIHD